MRSWIWPTSSFDGTVMTAKVRLDAQKEAVQQRLDGGRWQKVAEFVEIESGKRVTPAT